MHKHLKIIVSLLFFQRTIIRPITIHKYAENHIFADNCEKINQYISDDENKQYGRNFVSNVLFTFLCCKHYQFIKNNFSSRCLINMVTD